MIIYKSVWECVNHICSKTGSDRKIDAIRLSDASEVSNIQDIFNSFNSYYSQLGEKLAKSIQVVNNDSENINPLENSIYVYPTDENEIILAINKLKSKKSPGMDNIRAETFKEIAEEIAKPLDYLTNECFNQEYFPKKLKRGITKPLFKSGD